MRLMFGKRTRGRSVAGAMMAAAALLLAGCSTVTPPAAPRNKSCNQSRELCSATSSRFRNGPTQEVIGNSDGVAL